MENMLLIGLSRQMTLERQLDVVSNNVANVNTAGFKADRPLFEEYLKTGAHEDNFVGRDRSVSYVQDRGTFHDFSQGAMEQTRNPLDLAVGGNAFSRCRPRRRTLHPRRWPADEQCRSAWSPPAATRCSAPAGRSCFSRLITTSTFRLDGTVTVLEGALPHGSDPRQAPAGQLCRRAENC